VGGASFLRGLEIGKGDCFVSGLESERTNIVSGLERRGNLFQGTSNGRANFVSGLERRGNLFQGTSNGRANLVSGLERRGNLFQGTSNGLESGEGDKYCQ
jgi:hypothetical protein